MNTPIDITHVTLHTPRLTLRPFREGDLDDFYAYASVDGVGQMAGWQPHRNLEESRKILAMFIEGRKTFALEREGRVIGSLGIERYNEENYPELADLQGREIGYVLARDCWGQGLMPEAVRAVIDWLFGEIGLDFLLVGHFKWNRQSQRVIEKCGFGYLKEVEFHTRMGTVEETRAYILYRPAEPHFAVGIEAEDDTALVQAVYRRFDEAARLTRSRAAQIEFLTTTRIIEEYLTPGARILDIGAGAGAYSLHFARQGCTVSALELADANLAAFRARLAEEDAGVASRIDLVQGNALDLSRYADDSFDLVLLLGPLYHLHSKEDRLRCITEAKRVCRTDGRIFFAFIANDIVILTEQSFDPRYLLEGNYDKTTFTLDNFPFVFHTLDAARALLTDAGIAIEREVAADGPAELLADMINRMDEATYRQYLAYHAYICEKKEMLGMSNHLLFVGA